MGFGVGKRVGAVGNGVGELEGAAKIMNIELAVFMYPLRT